jgi:hypothetical protein
MSIYMYTYIYIYIYIYIHIYIQIYVYKQGLKSLLPLPPKPLLDIFEGEESVSGSVDTTYLGTYGNI